MPAFWMSMMVEQHKLVWTVRLPMLASMANLEGVHREV
jgi:hypothetical protein